jgi:hypothetical protein
MYRLQLDQQVTVRVNVSVSPSRNSCIHLKCPSVSAVEVSEAVVVAAPPVTCVTPDTVSNNEVTIDL